MASTDARPLPEKNVAYRVTFPILDADGDLVTGATGLDSEVSKDAGTFTDCTNEATEIATSSGMYYLELTSTEMNADTVAIIVKTSSSGAKTTSIVMYPEEAGDVRVNVTQVAGTTQTAGDIPAMVTVVDDFLDTEIAAIKAKTDNLPTDPADESTIHAKLDTIDDFLDTEIAAIKAKTDNLPEGVTKNAQLANFMFLMVDSSDHYTPKTGLTVTATRSIDGAAFAACANSVTEIANGVYKITLAAADLNGDVITLKFTSTGADQTTIVLKTEA